MSVLLPKDYAVLLADIKKRVGTAQYAAFRAVSQELVGLYWDIGRMILRRQAGASWGKAVVEKLAADLQQEFPGIKGFSASNLWRAKLFYETYAASAKLAPLVREIGWSHKLIIFERCKDPLEREFYLRMTRKFGWTKAVLIHQIENQSYEKPSSARPISTAPSRLSSAPKPSWPSRTSSPLTSWNWATSTASANWNVL
jgi:predicted nuclease of restriction endonuclease-like (RecB) superfamily